MNLFLLHNMIISAYYRAIALLSNEKRCKSEHQTEVLSRERKTFPLLISEIW